LFSCSPREAALPEEEEEEEGKKGGRKWKDEGKGREKARPLREKRIDGEPVLAERRKKNKRSSRLYTWVVKEASVACYERENRFHDSN